jgi:large subunit ribosomal protein L3
MKQHFFLIKTKTSQLFDKQGARLAVTHLQIPETRVLGTMPGADSLRYRVGVNQKSLSKTKKPQRQLAEKLGLKNGFYHIREIDVSKETVLKPGDSLPVDQILKVGDWVVVKAKTIGRGFAGVVKRWGFAGGPKTHGQSDRHRAPGSIGQRTSPGRVWKGKKMSGHMGNKAKTIKALNILKVDLDNHEVIVKGLVPGAKGGLVQLQRLDRPNKIIPLWTKEEKVSPPVQPAKQDETPTTKETPVTKSSDTPGDKKQ